MPSWCACSKASEISCSWRRDPSGTTYHYRYDNEGRCVETWADEPADYLAPGTPDTLADGSPARGIHHAKLEFLGDGMRHVITSLCVSTYSANGFGKLDSAVVDGGVYERTYDRWGNVLSYTDPLGAVTQFKRDLRGRIIEQLPEGAMLAVVEFGP